MILGTPNTFIPDWAVDFDGGQGILLGTAIGYSIGDNNPQHIFSGIRMEVEYFYRQSRHNQSSQVRGLSGATQQKIERGEFASGPYETLGSVISHNLFANVYYDFDNDTRFYALPRGWRGRGHHHGGLEQQLDPDVG